jgi:AcrR family transcriptional regulator
MVEVRQIVDCAVPNARKTSGRTGRPPLTERRKAETRLEVARAAVHLFLDKGVADTSADEIAEFAGISSRTLWRYFPSKESCIMPLLTGGIEATAQHLRAWRRDQGVTELLDVMWPPIKDAIVSRRTMLSLVRLTGAEPGLRAVWLEAHRAAEPVFGEALAHRAGLTEPNLTITLQAAMINVALRVGVEYYAFHPCPDPDVSVYETAIREALTAAAGSFSP